MRDWFPVTRRAWRRLKQALLRLASAQHTFTNRLKERVMTPEEMRQFHAVFQKFDETFAEMDKFFALARGDETPKTGGRAKTGMSENG